MYNSLLTVPLGVKYW